MSVLLSRLLREGEQKIPGRTTKTKNSKHFRSDHPCNLAPERKSTPFCVFPLQTFFIQASMTTRYMQHPDFKAMPTDPRGLHVDSKVSDVVSR